MAQTVLLLLTCAPVVALSVYSVLLALNGGQTAGPASGVFADVGLLANLLIPLLFISLGLTGFAIRENSPGYAFAAGLAANFAVVSGYALSAPAFGFGQAIRCTQLFAGAAALWAIVWLIARPKALAWRRVSEATSARALMSAQIGMAIVGNVLVLAPAVFTIIFATPSNQRLPVEAGSLFGWLAIGLTGAAMAIRGFQVRRRLRPEIAGLLGLAALALLACGVQAWTIQSAHDGGWWGYRALMLGFGMYALFVALATWWVATQRTPDSADGPPAALVRTAGVWVRVAGVAAVALALKAAFVHALSMNMRDDLVWAALAIGFSSVAGAVMAVWRRQEGWAFSAGLGVNLAASLIVCRLRFDAPLADWLALLTQANLIALGSVALLWLAARRRLSADRELGLTGGPLLRLQVILGLLLAASPLTLGLTDLLLAPRHANGLFVHLGAPASWLGSLLALAAAGWYLRQSDARRLIHLFAGGLLLIAALATCSAASWCKST